jgi:hypothetical protein
MAPMSWGMYSRNVLNAFCRDSIIYLFSPSLLLFLETPTGAYGRS